MGPGAGDALLDACPEITYTVQAGGTMTVYLSRIDGVTGEGYARALGALT